MLRTSPAMLLFLSCLLAPLATGCGGGTYEAQYETARTSVVKGSPYTYLERDPVTFDGTKVTIRLPKSPSSDQKWTVYIAESKDPGDPTIPIEKHVLRSHLFADREEMATMCEAWGTFDEVVTAGEMPVCAFLGVFDGKTITPTELETLIAARFANGHGAQEALKEVGKWESTVGKTPPAPDGTQREIPWRRLIAIGISKLEQKTQGSETVWKDVPVTYEAWMYVPPKAEAMVVVVWRVPLAVQSPKPGPRGKFPFSTAAPLSAGTLQIDGVVPAH